MISGALRGFFPSPDAIFEGQYGSDLENQLERELDWLLEQKHHVDQAYFRWRQAQLLTKEACGYLNEAVQKWKTLNTEANEYANRANRLLIKVIHCLLGNSLRFSSFQKH